MDLGIALSRYRNVEAEEDDKKLWLNVFLSTTNHVNGQRALNTEIKEAINE